MLRTCVAELNGMLQFLCSILRNQAMTRIVQWTLFSLVGASFILSQCMFVHAQWCSQGACNQIYDQPCARCLTQLVGCSVQSACTGNPCSPPGTCNCAAQAVPRNDTVPTACVCTVGGGWTDYALYTDMTGNVFTTTCADVTACSSGCSFGNCLASGGIINTWGCSQWKVFGDACRCAPGS